MYAVPHTDTACSLGAQKPLMTSKAQHVYMHPLHVNGKDSRCLGRIYHQADSVPEAYFTNPVQIHPVSGQVGGMGTHHRLCLRTYAFLQPVITQDSLLITGQNGQADSPFFHKIKRPKHRIVLQHRGNHMVPFGEQALDGRIQALRGITGKRNLQGITQVEQFRDSLPGLVNHPGRVQRCLVGSSARIAEILHGIRHCVYDTVRFSHGSSCIVKINHDSAFLSALIATVEPCPLN